MIEVEVWDNIGHICTEEYDNPLDVIYFICGDDCIFGYKNYYKIRFK